MMSTLYIPTTNGMASKWCEVDFATIHSRSPTWARSSRHHFCEKFSWQPLKRRLWFRCGSTCFMLDTYCGWTKSTSHHLEIMVETIVCWYLQGNRTISRFLSPLHSEGYANLHGQPSADGGVPKESGRPSEARAADDAAMFPKTCPRVAERSH